MDQTILPLPLTFLLLWTVSAIWTVYLKPAHLIIQVIEREQGMRSKLLRETIGPSLWPLRESTTDFKLKCLLYKQM